MSDSVYHVIVTGKTAVTEAELLPAMAEIFDKTEIQMQRLLKMAPIAIRKQVDQATAEDYQTRLSAIGLSIELQQEETEPAVHDGWSLEPTANEASVAPIKGKASFAIDEEGIEGFSLHTDQSATESKQTSSDDE